MTNAPSVKTTLLLAVGQLKAQGFEAETARLEAEVLLQYVLKVNRAWLISHENDALESNIHAVFEALLNRRANGEPIAYILGYREFYGLKLKVSPDTLIPRPDTETLVDAALAKIDVLLSPFPPFFPSPLAPLPQASEGNQAANLSPSPARERGVGERGNVTILDLGTGSGAIALAIAKHRPQAHVTALDASQAALNIAIENAQNLNFSNVNFILSDWFSALTNEKFDVIVSNPPYIEANDAHLKQGDLRFEPISALASGADGLDAIRTIITQAPQHLNPHGCLLLDSIADLPNILL